MTPQEARDLSALIHALNNLLGKIMGAAELALDHAAPAPVRRELQVILHLAEEGAGLVAALPGIAPPEA